MVSSGAKAEKRNDPEYSLDAIRRLARFQQVEYRGRKVPRDVASLGYDLNDVCQCLISLQHDHFSHSERYENFPRWHDVYKVRHVGQDGIEHNLYIKLRLDRDCVVIELCSFHT